MTKKPFRILSLSGGGARGIFQAKVLSNLQDHLNIPFYEYFDLICGTSTGAIIAIALSINVSPDRIVNLYKNKSEKIFNTNLLSYITRGPRYDSTVLRNELENVYGKLKISDVKTRLLITSSCIDQYSHRIFCSFRENETSDHALSLVDVALASSAAPTYFKPIRPDGQERSYLDGGLWANSPCLISVLWANHFLQVPLETMRVLAVGTGNFPSGALVDNFKNFRPISKNSIGSTFELMFASQESSAEFHTRQIIGSSNYYNINCQLDEPIHLDEAKKANKKLPALAEMVVDENINVILNFLKKKNTIKLIDSEIKKKLVQDELIEEAGLTAIYPSRKYYSYRKKTSAIDTYINTAQQSLIMVSINLMTGLPFNNIIAVLRKKFEDENIGFNAIISLINPFDSELIRTISPILSKSKNQLTESIVDTLRQLLTFKKSLSSNSQKQLAIRVHNSLPFGSAIIIDHNEPYGRIQIETKPYKAVLNDSFAIEIAPIGNSGLFNRLVESYIKLIKDGRLVEETDIDNAIT